MQSFLKFITLLMIITFFYFVFNFYFSTINAKKFNLKRINAEDFIKNNLNDIPVLKNDTENIIEFNSSFANEIKPDEPRNFWNLLKIK